MKPHGDCPKKPGLAWDQPTKTVRLPITSWEQMKLASALTGVPIGWLVARAWKFWERERRLGGSWIAEVRGEYVAARRGAGDLLGLNKPKHSGDPRVGSDDARGLGREEP